MAAAFCLGVLFSSGTCLPPEQKKVDASNPRRGEPMQESQLLPHHGVFAAPFSVDTNIILDQRLQMIREVFQEDLRGL